MFERYFECSLTSYYREGDTTLNDEHGGSWDHHELPFADVCEWPCARPAPSGIPATRQFAVRADPQPDELLRPLPARRRLHRVLQQLQDLLRGEHPEILRDRVFRDHPFPSTNIWDGPSRGHYHTGSQIAVWRALEMWIALASECGATRPRDHVVQRGRGLQGRHSQQVHVYRTLRNQSGRRVGRNGHVDQTTRATTPKRFYVEGEGSIDPDNSRPSPIYGQEANTTTTVLCTGDRLHDVGCRQPSRRRF